MLLTKTASSGYL